MKKKCIFFSVYLQCKILIFCFFKCLTVCFILIFSFFCLKCFLLNWAVWYIIFLFFFYLIPFSSLSHLHFFLTQYLSTFLSSLFYLLFFYCFSLFFFIPIYFCPFFFFLSLNAYIFSFSPSILILFTFYLLFSLSFF